MLPPWNILRKQYIPGSFHLYFNNTSLFVATNHLFNVKRERYLNNILIFHHMLLKMPDIFLDPYGKGTFFPAKCVPSWEQRSRVLYTCHAS